MTHTVQFAFSFEEMKDYLERKGYQVVKTQVPYSVSGGYEDRMVSSYQVFENGVNAAEWLASTPGDYAVRWVFETALRRKLLE
jgi:hypothetical protein